MPAPDAIYEQLLSRVREAALVQSVSSLLSWDEQTMMPKEGALHRGRQLALLAGIHHEKATAPEVGGLLDALQGSRWLQEEAPLAARRNVEEIRRSYARLGKLPRALVEELAALLPLAQQAWVEARRSRAFSAFAPFLQKVLALKREEAKAVSEDAADLYDALLDEHEPGMRTAEVAALLDELASSLSPLVKAATERPPPAPPFAGRTFSLEKQRLLCESLAPALGLSPGGSRLDVSAHPFSSRIGPGDVRITTRYDAADLTSAFFGTLHETGHALYEQGLDPAHDGTPVGEARSLGLHESQSRLWENLVGRSRAFWVHYHPVVRSLFPEALWDVDLDAFHRAVNRVAPSPIRVEADEVTYNLHIVVRLRLERALLSGDLPVADLPGAWSEAYATIVGVTPRDDAEGCLQDVHWASGAFGYFPTYALGNLYAAQLMEAARADLPDLDGDLAAGRFAPLLSWLREKVHRQGFLARGAEVVRAATGRAPDARALLRHLEGKLRAAAPS